jgi:glycosyltransferase involved in cell wall biosynthesis
VTARRGKGERASNGRADVRVYLDVSPLMEEHWTGIPIVAAGLASALLGRFGEQARFFLGPSLIETELVRAALREASGEILLRETACGRAWASRLPLLEGGAPSIGIFPSVKPMHRAFTVECCVFHDLSTLVLPQFHIVGNVRHHMETILADIASSEVVVAVSAATRDDLIAYLGVQAERIVVAANGVSWPAHYAVDAANLLAPAGAEPYVLILGTREPRKNVLAVFDMLRRTPQVLETHRFVFAGKMGWLEELHELPAALEAAKAAGRIVFTGFVHDAVKYRLLAGAEATLYPSFFEGFGLPVLESLSAGTPVVASWSSAIPEVGGELCRYFDPFSPDDMLRATRELLAWRREAGPDLAARCRAYAARFTWDAALATILDRATSLLTARRD